MKSCCCLVLGLRTVRAEFSNTPPTIGGHKVMGVKRNGVTSNVLLETRYFFQKDGNRPLLLSPFLLRGLKRINERYFFLNHCK